MQIVDFGGCARWCERKKTGPLPCVDQLIWLNRIASCEMHAQREFSRHSMLSCIGCLDQVMLILIASDGRQKAIHPFIDNTRAASGTLWHERTVDDLGF